ncbi:DNA polymerase III subunit delta [Gluconacetobacter sp. SXCC-1]|uniref:DNA-directed DNA polymerase n=1 Tax=Komagataeibacter rhaeticus TaxID=215221 RepID=A0A181C7P1_9PROT|nr:DNA polymerase III subunit delta [Komagataeibacter rhaeticus]ATU73655.1 DNA polymerase III subunit delta [Komagataeibacter xylinus]EGG76398.1 DNA polymerase III subunit delta [Gluconacetobacter sp. SXCC-1]QIP34509.1 DNA polymerase III subunit delta [Komagataeibacter rhaeticus]QOC47026.1 DNA polymerase III subunit delta [Komagataeibacter rhaeticus]WPP20638.1 DNA polymerase III subunit delta [Komagataeibacter rhaeticus]
MKVSPRNIGATLQAPGNLRVIMLHGDDVGLIRERATTAAKAICPDLHDPFRVAMLGRADHARLEEEMTALSLTGGRRVIWLREGTDEGLLEALKRGLAQQSDALVIVEAPGLDSRSRLRGFVEKDAQCALIGCYPEEGRALEGAIRQMLAAQDVGIDPDALGWMVERAGPDRAATRSEVEKLALFAGRGGRLGLEDVRACVGDAAGVSMEDAAFAAMAGQRREADAAAQRALTVDGSSPSNLTRALMSHIHRLRRARLAMDAGMSRADAMRQLQPPVFFKRTDSFGQALGLWPADALLRAAQDTQTLELACRQTGSPDIVLCLRHVARLCGLAQQARRRR